MMSFDFNWSVEESRDVNLFDIPPDRPLENIAISNEDVHLSSVDFAFGMVYSSDIVSTIILYGVKTVVLDIISYVH